MPIFRKSIKRIHCVNIAVEANSKEEADETYNEWLSENDNAYELGKTLDENLKEESEWIMGFSNWDSYNRAFTIAMDDFQIKAKPKEPTYMLYISYPTKGINEVWHKIKFDEVLDKLKVRNICWVLRPTNPPLDVMQEYQNYNCPDNFLRYFEAIERKA